MTAPVCTQDKYQRNALHWAAEAGQVDAAECLIDYGIDQLATECNGRWVAGREWAGTVTPAKGGGAGGRAA